MLKLFSITVPGYMPLVLTISIGLAPPHLLARSADFVHTKGMHLMRGGKKYTFMGTNFWYGPNLGASNKPRLRRELDRLRALGIRNLRILAASEGPDSERWRIVPALQTAPGVYNEKLLVGLDYLLTEMAARDMTAVLVLGNYWHWSGGFGQYVNWAGMGAIPYPKFDPEARGGTDSNLSSWWRWFWYNYFVTRFYGNVKAVSYYHDTVRMLVSRVNSVNHRHYKNDPTIMAWQLANEPAGFMSGDSYDKWIAATARLIKSLDRNHLVSTGAMGEVFQFSGNDQVKNHAHADIDYTTVHIWVQNSGLYDPWKAGETYEKAAAVLHKQLAQHREMAHRLKKPIVFEEFGFSRDMNRFGPGTPVILRDAFYAQAFSHVLASLETDSPVAGVNFWAWGGEGRPTHVEWVPGDMFIGDPPHEAQGWYSVYDTDVSTLKVISQFARRISQDR